MRPPLANAWNRTTAGLARVAALVALVALAALGLAARANADSSSEYHEVARFGGFDESGFDFGAYGQPLAAGKFLEPTGFAVDAQDQADEVLFVADRTSSAESSPSTWRIQQLSSTGVVLGTTTFTLPGGAKRSSSIVGLAVDHNAGRLYALVMGPVRETDGYAGRARSAQELVAWSTTPVAGGLVAAAAREGEQPLQADPLASSLGQGTVGAVISDEAQLNPTSGVPLYDPQGIVVDHLETSGVDDPVAIEASDLSGSTPASVTQKEEGAYEDERNGNTVVQQVATQGSVGALLAQWTSASIAGELGGAHTGAPRGISDDPDGSISALLYAGERSAYVVELSPALGQPRLLDSGVNAPAAADQAIMGIDPGPFFTGEPGSLFDETMNAGPEVVQLSSGLYAADFALPPPASRFVPPPYWRSEEAGVNIGVRLLQPSTEGLISSLQGTTIVNTLGEEASSCAISAQEATLAAGAEGVLWVLDRGPTSGMLAAELEPEPGLKPGREIIELAPGAGSAGEGCPQPSGTFTMGLACGSSQPAGEALTAPAGGEVTFDAGSVKLPNATKEHPNGTAFDYEWEIEPEGSGSPGSAPDASKITHTFTTPGAYTVRLKIRSDYGTYTLPPATVDVTATQSLAPRSQFTVTSAPGAQQAEFDASGSAPGACRAIAYYLWSWGDGTAPESDSPQTPVLTHTYAEPGTYAVTLTVVNNHYQSVVSASQTVTVDPFAQPPVLAEAPLLAAAPQGPVLPPNRSATRLLANAHFAGGKLDVNLSCPASKVSCTGTVQVEALASFASVAGALKRASKRARPKPRAKRLTIGERSFEIAGGRSETVTVRLTAKGLALLQKARRLPVLVTVLARDSFGDPGTSTVKLTLRAAGLGGQRTSTKHHG